MAYFVASVSPSAPIMAIYIHEMVRMLALPHGAAATGPMCFLVGTSRCDVRSSQRDDPTKREVNTGWLGKNETRCFATPIGPTPGPPPPCGMQNVLCRFKWQTSAPINPGEVKPTCAFMFAPSI